MKLPINHGGRRPGPKKGQLTFYLALLLGVLIVMFLLRQCSSSRGDGGDPLGLAGGDTLNVAIDYSPMSLYTYADTLGGFNYDVMRQIAAHSGMAVKFHPITGLNRALERLDSGYYDIVVADIPSVAAYKDRFLFTEPVFLDRSVLVQRADTLHAIRSQLDLAGKSVTVVAGSPLADRIKNLSEEIGDTIYIKEDSLYSAEQLVMLVAAGEIDFAVVNEGIARSVAAANSCIDVSTGVSFTQFQSWIVAKGNKDLCRRLDKALNDFKRLPAYDSLLVRYGLRLRAGPTINVSVRAVNR